MTGLQLLSTFDKRQAQVSTTWVKAKLPPHPYTVHDPTTSAEKLPVSQHLKEGVVVHILSHIILGPRSAAPYAMNPTPGGINLHTVQSIPNHHKSP